MRGLLTAAFVFAGFLSAAADDEAPFADVVPAKMSISYAHEMRGVWTVELKKGQIKCVDPDGRCTSIVQPTPQQWSTFIAELNQAKVYKWDGHYRGPRMADDAGFSWSVDIQLGEKRFVSDGTSAFPLDGDIDPVSRKGPHAAFDLMIKAVSQLIGRDFP